MELVYFFFYSKKAQAASSLYDIMMRENNSHVHFPQFWFVFQETLYDFPTRDREMFLLL